jgi:hypothetical protein
MVIEEELVYLVSLLEGYRIGNASIHLYGIFLCVGGAFKFIIIL